MSNSTKTPSRWDALGDYGTSDGGHRNYDRGGRRQRRATMGELLDREDKWVTVKPRKQYTRAPDSNSTRQFPSLGPSEAGASEAGASEAGASEAGASEAGAGTDPSGAVDYTALSFTDEPATPVVPDKHTGMVRLRNYKHRTPDAAAENDSDPSYDMYWAVENMKTRWYRHNELQGIFIDYDDIPDAEGLDAWDTDDESENSETEDEYDAA